MTKSEVLEFIRNNPACSMATVDDGAPRVRTMKIHRADDDGIILVIFKHKECIAQLMKDSRVELCFTHDFHQVRVSGELEELDDNTIRDEVLAQRGPAKQFAERFGLDEYYRALGIYVLKNGTAKDWTSVNNFEPTIPIQL